MDRKQLADCLKCTNTIGSKCHNDCPYLTKEELEGKYITMADEVIDGKYYVWVCDYESMALAAAALLTMHGNWQKTDHNTVTCSNCGLVISEKQKWFRFCPGCGAEMEADDAQ